MVQEKKKIKVFFVFSLCFDFEANLILLSSFCQLRLCANYYLITRYFCELIVANIIIGNYKKNSCYHRKILLTFQIFVTRQDPLVPCLSICGNNILTCRTIDLLSLVFGKDLNILSDIMAQTSFGYSSIFARFPNCDIQVGRIA